MRLVLGLVNWRRALLLLPVLAVLAAGLYYVVAWRDDTASTPRASLLDTTAFDELEVGTAKGHVARDFLAHTPGGDPVRLSDLRGTPVIVNFWASWCTSCLAEIPDLRDLQDELGAEQLGVLALNVGESTERARSFIRDLDAESLLTALDPTLVVADTYRVRGMPQSVFIDSEGVIRAVYVGQLTEDVLRAYTEAASLGADAVEREGELRLVTTVARERVLDVLSIDGGVVEFRSKSLRCDDGYCAGPVVDTIENAAGVMSTEYRSDEDPAAVIVTFVEGRTDVETLAELVKRELMALEDPLYTRPLEVRFR